MHQATNSQQLIRPAIFDTATNRNNGVSVLAEEQDEEGTLAGTGRGAAAVSGAAADGEAAFLGRATPLPRVPPSSVSKISIPGQQGSPVAGCH